MYSQGRRIILLHLHFAQFSSKTSGWSRDKFHVTLQCCSSSSSSMSFLQVSPKYVITIKMDMVMMIIRMEEIIVMTTVMTPGGHWGGQRQRPGKAGRRKWLCCRCLVRIPNFKILQVLTLTLSLAGSQKRAKHVTRRSQDWKGWTTSQTSKSNMEKTRV